MNKNITKVKILGAEYQISCPPDESAQVKDAVNASLHEISQREYYFPFNHTTGSLTLVAGTKSYTLATALKIADWNSFRINIISISPSLV